ncbi:MAG TPA: prolyl oligopeptidase family serine peptidase [Parvularculaceae bacterium]|nr:prolyl oligopeptidase family serine peptidase [Parvularculaceae bacterium]
MLKSTIMAAAVGAALISAGAAAAADKDPFQWLEEVENPKALDWARAENAKTFAVLEKNPLFDTVRAEALAILNSKARIPFGSIHNGMVYNFWQDEAHVRGLWRRASVESYRSGDPKWEVLIDYDALAKAEDKNWVAEGVNCLEPEYRHCMVRLSDGGTDANVAREFDTKTKEFVKDGFYVPEAKSQVSWLDKDTLAVGTDWGAGTLTKSGYPRTARLWKRGEALASLPVFFEGAETDVADGLQVIHDGGEAYLFGDKSVSFFESERYYWPKLDADPVKLPLPLNADLQGVLGGRAFFSLREPWNYQGADYSQGAVVAYDLASGKAETVFAPAANEAVEDVETSKSNIIIQYLEDVSGKAARLTRDKHGKWTAQEISMPANGVVKVISAGGGTDDAMLSYESITTPNTLYYVTAKNKLSQIAQAPAFYDASDIEVEQRFATSKDGTKIPYFIAGKKEVLAKGDAPTIQYAYGGFLIPTLPLYYEDPGRPQHGALAGKVWMSRGGVLVLANIRGGSEYGPEWHKGSMKEKHQNAIDDFIAVSEDLIKTGVTSPDKLGAIGRSNGGLLMGAVFTQRPDLYKAIDCGAPLLDMKRYTHLGAGASWVGEYGDPDIPDQWAYISKYSPYQNVEKGAHYPKVFFYTSTKDDRVHPGHARKMAAKMESYGEPFFYYENIEGGHSGTANQDELAFRTALEFTYFMSMLVEAPAAGAQ